MSSTDHDSYDIEQINSVASAASDALWSQCTSSTPPRRTMSSDSESEPACVLVENNSHDNFLPERFRQTIEKRDDARALGNLTQRASENDGAEGSVDNGFAVNSMGNQSHSQASAAVSKSLTAEKHCQQEPQHRPVTSKIFQKKPNMHNSVVPRAKFTSAHSATPQYASPAEHNVASARVDRHLASSPVLLPQATHGCNNDPKKPAEGQDWVLPFIVGPGKLAKIAESNGKVIPANECKQSDTNNTGQDGAHGEARVVDSAGQVKNKRQTPPHHLDLQTSKKRCVGSESQGQTKQLEQENGFTATSYSQMDREGADRVKSPDLHALKEPHMQTSNHLAPAVSRSEQFSIRRLASASFEKCTPPTVDNQQQSLPNESRNNDMAMRDQQSIERQQPIQLQEPGKPYMQDEAQYSGRQESRDTGTRGHGDGPSSRRDKADSSAVVGNERSWVDFLTQIGNTGMSGKADDRVPHRTSKTVLSSQASDQSHRSAMAQGHAGKSKPDMSADSRFPSSGSSGGHSIHEQEQERMKQKLTELAHRHQLESSDSNSDHSLRSLPSCFRNIFTSTASGGKGPSSNSSSSSNGPNLSPFSYPSSSDPGLGEVTNCNGLVGPGSNQYPKECVPVSAIQTQSREISAEPSMLGKLPPFAGMSGLSQGTSSKVPPVRSDQYPPSILDYSLFNTNLPLNSPVASHVPGMMPGPSSTWPATCPYPSTPTQPPYPPYYNPHQPSYMPAQYPQPPYGVHHPAHYRVASHGGHAPPPPPPPPSMPIKSLPTQPMPVPPVPGGQHPSSAYSYQPKVPNSITTPCASLQGSSNMRASGGLSQLSDINTASPYGGRAPVQQSLSASNQMKSNHSLFGKHSGTRVPESKPCAAVDEAPEGIDPLLLLMATNTSTGDSQMNCSDQQLCDFFEKEQTGIFSAVAASSQSDSSLKELPPAGSKSLEAPSSYLNGENCTEAHQSLPAIKYPMDDTCEAVRKRRSNTDPSHRAKRSRRSLPIISQSSALQSIAYSAPKPGVAAQAQAATTTTILSVAAETACSALPLSLASLCHSNNIWSEACGTSQLCMQSSSANNNFPHLTESAEMRRASEHRAKPPSPVQHMPSNPFPAQAHANTAHAISSQVIDQIISMGTGASNAEGSLKELGLSLLNSDLWTQFHMHCTEMIVTRQGRKIFPRLQLEIKGLKSEERYSLHIVIAPMDTTLWRWQGGRWIRSGQADSTPHVCWSPHQDSPNTGNHWMQGTPVVFDKVRLSNNRACSQHPPRKEQILVQTMRRYIPQILICMLDNNDQPKEWRMMAFAETEFIPVTAYQNQAIIDLKVNHNPFAKGFRNKGK